MNPLSYFILAYQDVLYRNVFLSLDRLIVASHTHLPIAGFGLLTICDL